MRLTRGDTPCAWYAAAGGYWWTLAFKYGRYTAVAVAVVGCWGGGGSTVGVCVGGMAAGDCGMNGRRKGELTVLVMPFVALGCDGAGATTAGRTTDGVAILGLTLSAANGTGDGWWWWW